MTPYQKELLRAVASSGAWALPALGNRWRNARGEVLQVRGAVVRGKGHLDELVRLGVLETYTHTPGKPVAPWYNTHRLSYFVTQTGAETYKEMTCHQQSPDCSLPTSSDASTQPIASTETSQKPEPQRS